MTASDRSSRPRRNRATPEGARLAKTSMRPPQGDDLQNCTFDRESSALSFLQVNVRRWPRGRGSPRPRRSGERLVTAETVILNVAAPEELRAIPVRQPALVRSA